MTASAELPLDDFSFPLSIVDEIHGKTSQIDAERSSLTARCAPDISIWRSALIIAILSGTTTASTMTTGLLVVSLPRMAQDLDLSDHLLLWLTSGCSMLVAGCVADVVGSRNVYLVGCLALSLSVLGSGLSRTSTELLICRGVQGIAYSMCSPTAMSLLTLHLPLGKRRNIGFAFTGAGQTLGYSVGLFLGGVFADSVGWRYGWYVTSIIALLVLLASIFGLPKHVADGVHSGRLTKIAKEIDWVGTIVATSCLGMISYVLGAVANTPSSIRDAAQITLICIAGLCIPFFAWWMGNQHRRGKAVLIPNHIWRKVSFSVICATVFFSWAVVQTTSYSLSLYFQKIQHLSALQTSLRFLPDIALGIGLSIATGTVLHRASAYWIVVGSMCLTAVSPLLMALMKPEWPYWYAAFWAVLLSQASADVLFVVSSLVITAAFPPEMQALAGAVFNTVCQFGTAVGLGIMGVISSSVTQSYAEKNESADGPAVLLEGYHAMYWACFGISVFTCGLGAIGLRGLANKGMKIDT